MSSAPNISLPKPTITPISQPFWDNLKQKKLSLQVCQSCDKWIFFTRVTIVHTALGLRLFGVKLRKSKNQIMECRTTSRTPCMAGENPLCSGSCRARRRTINANSFMGRPKGFSIPKGSRDFL